MNKKKFELVDNEPAGATGEMEINGEKFSTCDIGDFLFFETKMQLSAAAHKKLRKSLEGIFKDTGKKCIVLEEGMKVKRFKEVPNVWPCSHIVSRTDRNEYGEPFKLPWRYEVESAGIEITVPSNWKSCPDCGAVRPEDNTK